MQKSIITIGLMFLFSLILASVGFAHVGGHGAHAEALRTWTKATTNERFTASFLFAHDEHVHLESNAGRIVTLPLAQLVAADREYVAARQARVARLNAPRAPARSSSAMPMLTMLLLMGLAGLWFYRYGSDAAQRRIAFVSAALLLYSIAYTTRQQAQTRPAQAASFEAFSPKVVGFHPRHFQSKR